MRILLLSAYEAQSHKQWRLGLLENLSHHDWTYLTLPPRHFSWRIRGNSLYWSQSQADILAKDYDLVLATSMVDLSSLRGLSPQLAQVPNILYFHENQFAYPASEKQHSSIEPQVVTLYAALCADQLLFNTQYNLDTFIKGVDILLDKFPDYVPENIAKKLAKKAKVFPVPLANDWFQQRANQSDSTGTYNYKQPYELVWNHRWEYDKGPDRLLNLIEQLPADLPLQWHILGQCFRQKPAAFTKLYEILSARGWLGQWGFIKDKDEYKRLLNSAHSVVSTAIHDFQGLAVLEAMASGCLPLVPDRLSYPEFVPNEYRYKSTLSDEQTEAKAAAQLIQLRLNKPNDFRAIDIQRYSWLNLANTYEECLESTVSNTLTEL